MTRSLTSPAALAAASDQCVKCGLCLPHCPTYNVLREEADSPRGRISLIQGLSDGRLSLSDPLVEHLDRCLLCQSCEHVCPAKVPFHDLMVGARRQIGAGGHVKRQTGLRLERILDRPGGGDLLSWLLLVYRFCGLQWLLRHSGLLPAALARTEGYLPSPSPPLGHREYYAANGTERGRIGLFTGCMGRDFDTQTVKSAIRLLTAYGFAVIVPRARHCCGAMRLHRGDIETAQEQARNGLAAFAEFEVDAIVLTSSACAATLGDAIAAEEQVAPVVEICRFLVTHVATEGKVTYRPLQETVAVHTPCSQAHALKDQTSPVELLSRIPDIQLRHLSSSTGHESRCCGGAGSYMLEQAELADRIRQHTLDELAATGAKIAVTTNIGCALHIGKGLREAGVGQRLMHPVTLLSKQLTNT